MNGLKYINDILDDNGNILSLHNLNNKFNTNWSVMSYNSVCSAIPRPWKRTFKNTTSIEVDVSIHVTINKKKQKIEVVSSKDVYWELIRKLVTKPKACLKWESLYDLAIFDWDYIFTLPYETSRETSLQSLQYQIIHRFYPCNSILHKWYENHEHTCMHCNGDDTLEHYFYSCNQTKMFWNAFQHWWYNATSVTLNLNMYEIIFGVLNLNNDVLLDSLNYCILYGKMHIARQKRDEKNCNINMFLAQLKYRLEYEKIICTANSCLEYFTTKWTHILDSI